MARNAATIRKEIASIVIAQTKVRDRVHKVAGWCLEHYKAHGDTTLCSELVNGLKKSGAYRKALIEWFDTHGHMVSKRENDGLVFSKKDGFDHTTVDLDKAAANPFYEKDTDADAKAPKFDALKAIEKLVKRQTKAEQNKEEYEVFNPFTPEEMVILSKLQTGGYRSKRAH